jgi:hypothetical protein
LVVVKKRLGVKWFTDTNAAGDCDCKLGWLAGISCRNRKNPSKGNDMLTNQSTRDIEQLMAEADELIRQINSDAIKDMKEEQRLQFEVHAQNLKKIKSEAQRKSHKKGTSQGDAGAEGMHEAILDIVKAMHNFKKNLYNA